jgi:hypothetical protein
VTITSDTRRRYRRWRCCWESTATNTNTDPISANSATACPTTATDDATTCRRQQKQHSWCETWKVQQTQCCQSSVSTHPFDSLHSAPAAVVIFARIRRGVVRAAAAFTNQPQQLRVHRQWLALSVKLRVDGQNSANACSLAHSSICRYKIHCRRKPSQQSSKSGPSKSRGSATTTMVDYRKTTTVQHTAENFDDTDADFDSVMSTWPDALLEVVQLCKDDDECLSDPAQLEAMSSELVAEVRLRTNLTRARARAHTHTHTLTTLSPCTHSTPVSNCAPMHCQSCTLTSAHSHVDSN